MDRDADVVVVGAGLAGLRAARDLGEAGLGVAVLEARDRVAGRGWSTRLGGRLVELGGSWFTSDHREVFAELARYGLGVREFPPIRHVRWLTGGELRYGLPVPWSELGELERVLAQVRNDAHAYAAGNELVGAQSAARYVESLGPTPALRDFLLGWWQLIGGAPPEKGAIGDVLSSIVNHGGLTGLVTSLSHGPESGWSVLAERLAGAPGLAVRLRQTVTRVTQHDGAVGLTTETGDHVRALAAVIAVPLNCLSDIEFDPSLPSPLAAAAGQNAGAAVKLVMLVRGVAPHGIAVGHGSGVGLSWWYVDDEVDGVVRMTGFGWRQPGFDPSNRADVEAVLATFFPEGQLVEWASHDWIGDPASRGTWLTAPADKIDLVNPQRFLPFGRLAFAGSDMAAKEAGWFEGALRSGAAAADYIRESLRPT